MNSRYQLRILNKYRLAILMLYLINCYFRVALCKCGKKWHENNKVPLFFDLFHSIDVVWHDFIVSLNWFFYFNSLFYLNRK